MTRHSTTRLRGTLLRIGVAFTSLALMLGLTEIGLRLFWDGFYVKTPKAYAQPHPVRGWSNRPLASVPYGEPEFSTTVTHDRFGFRSKPVETERTPGRVRVLVLGDSFAYGVGVENDETFSARMEALAPELEVINAGVNGYGTAQELMLLRDEGLQLQPDIVITAFYWNDVGNNMRENVARFELENGELVYPDPPPAPSEPVARQPEPAEDEDEEKGHRAWLRYSYTYRFVSDRAKLLGYSLKVMLGLPLEESDFVRDEDREAAWELQLALLREIDRVSREVGARMLLLVIPEQAQLQPELRIVGLEQADYRVQERLRDFARAAQIPMVDPLPALREVYEDTGEPLYYLRDRHLRANGHEIVARELVAELRELGWLRSGSE